MQATTLTPQQQQEVRQQVAGFLARSPAYDRMPPAQKAQVLADTERVVGAMAEGRSAADADPYAGLHYARAQADLQQGSITNVSDANTGKVISGGAKEMMGKSIGAAGSIIDVGVTEAAKMIREIDFPTFVAKLIEGTFHAIVKSSIEQMKAYAEMVRSVSTSLNDFKDRNTTDNQARDHLVSRYPGLLQIAVTDGDPKVTLRDNANTDNLPDFQKDLGLSESVTDLDDETIETKLVPAARDDLARGRQQLLATIILMGINRIVVTDGRINAKIKFNFSAKEKRKVNASAFDYANVGQIMTASHTLKDLSGGSTDTSGGAAPGETTGMTAEQKYALAQQAMQNADNVNRYARGYDDTSSVQPDVRVSSQVDMSNEGSIQASGQVMGEVQVNFKSDVFPLEKLVDTDQLQKLTQAQGAGRGAPPAATPGATQSSPRAAANLPAGPLPPPQANPPSQAVAK
jgi:hypothetical protein